MTNLKDLLTRVEGATEGSLDLSARVCIATGYAGPNSEGAENIRTDPDWEDDLLFEVEGKDCCNRVPDVSESLDAALALVSRVLPGWLRWIDEHFDHDAKPFWIATLTSPEIGTGEAEAPSPALALLAAMLKALLAKPGSEA